MFEDIIPVKTYSIDEFISELPEIIKEKRKSLEITQEKLSQLTNLRRDYLAQLETRPIRHKPLFNILKILKRLNCEIIVEIRQI